MRILRDTSRALALMSAPLLLAFGCNAGRRAFSSPPQPMPGYQDEPAPLHTGGLSVLSGQPEHGFGLTTAGHGSPAADAIATGIGLAVVGATTVKTVDACKQPNASAACLRGPSALDYVSDAGTQ
jgi:hypothetical protein